jgi:hypothetical protein
MGRINMHTEVWWVNRREEREKILIKWILQKYNWMAWTGFVWIRIATVGENL